MNEQSLLLFRAVKEASAAIELDGGLRSQLRRADLRDLVGIEHVHRFAESLPGMDEDEAIERAGACLILMAHRQVQSFRNARWDQHPAELTVARAWGERRGSDRTVLSPLRFQRLLRAADAVDRLSQFRRGLGLLDQRQHPFSVAEGYLALLDPSGRRKFARHYFTGGDLADRSPSPAALLAHPSLPLSST